MWAKIITIKITKDLNYVSLCALNLLKHEFHNLSWITEINELFHDILIYWDAPVHTSCLIPGIAKQRIYPRIQDMCMCYCQHNLVQSNQICLILHSKKNAGLNTTQRLRYCPEG